MKRVKPNSDSGIRRACRPAWPLAHSFFAFLLAVLLTGCSNVTEADFQEGMDAYARGDFATAMKKWKPLAEDGNPSAQTNLGVMYYQGRGLDAPNYQEALRWYRIAAMQGYPDAQFNLGLAHMEGKGVARDFTQAVRWYKMAGESGYLQAQIMLADMYLKGQGVAGDQNEAAKWYSLAADQGSAVAQYVLGNLHIGGKGVTADLTQAYKWFTIMAKTTGDENARGNAERSMEILKERMTQAQIIQAGNMAQDWIDARATN
ncbi:MAG: sel1 repeat family protein [Acidobacteria bacterium]|nr:sel1 repeat family protein [Acidobacteriota bacterium]